MVATKCGMGTSTEYDIKNLKEKIHGSKQKREREKGCQYNYLNFSSGLTQEIYGLNLEF